ncbi:hypothetical protein [Chryseobacterium cucumeris]|uniref:hypothetical protein n=1 Tax=Chryseobacterium cucumeris TaxID=1813611 RepID=UPI003D99D45F
MANTVHLISKGYLNPNKIADIIENVAEKLNFNFFKTYNSKFDIIDINLIEKNGSEGFLETSISCYSDYNNTFNQLYNISNYGLMVSINYSYNNTLLIPFLIEMLEELPELLVYNEEVPDGIGSYIFNKDHLKNFSGTDSYTFLNKVPKN